jgi:hypothetical protein
MEIIRDVEAVRLEVHGAYGVPAYGISKAAMNWFTL